MLYWLVIHVFFFGTFNIDFGINIYHNCIGDASKMFAPAVLKRKLKYRSIEKFNGEPFDKDIRAIPYQMCEVFDDVDDIYWAHNQLLIFVVNEHIPLNVKIISGEQVPYMNSD